MSLILDGSNGVSDIDGSASTPAIRGTDANTGIFFPAADTIAFAEGGVESMRLDSSGNVGIGTSSPSGAAGRNLTIYNSSGQSRLSLKNSVTGDSSNDGFQVGIDGDGVALLDQRENLEMRFSTNATERMRITSGGDLLVNTTSNSLSGKVNVSGVSAVGGGCVTMSGYGDGIGYALRMQQSTTNAVPVQFLNSSGTQIGTISTTNTTTAYNTSSDYRLKHDIQPMTGALAKVAQLKPVTYKWNADDSESQGFIAHELQEVVPDCVTGKKDAVDEEGNPVYQGVDTSFLVATLTSAIQELHEIVKAQAAEIAALKNPPQPVTE